MVEEKHQKIFDIVHVEHLRGSRYGIFLKSKFPGMPLVWDSVDSISHLFKQASNQSQSIFQKMITHLELGRTRKAEGNLVCLFDHVLVTSSIDKNALLETVRGRNKPAPISVMPNGVDLDYYQPNQDVQRDPETIIFSGKMSYHANISMVNYFVAEILPKIWKKRPGVRLIVVGKDPPIDIIKMAVNPLITVTGTVADIRPYLWKAAVAVVPLVYGAGIQNKVLEAMACGTPVVATPKALSALNAVSGQDILIADSPQDFSFQMLRLIENPGLRYEIGNAGLDYVRKNHNWKNIASQLVDIYEETIVYTKHHAQ
jgi:glycosyltransferase involved in cell wall biosynthesis